jgi:uncharacterized protein
VPPPHERVTVGPFPWWVRGGHLETLVGALTPAPGRPPASRRRVVPVDDTNAVETWCSAPAEARAGSLLLVHGLGGSVRRPHVVALAAEAVRRGWHAVRVNMRNHGGTAALSSTLFNAAQSDDIGTVLGAMEDAALPRPYAVVGVSLGASLALRYGALAGSASRADVFVALNPALDFFAIERRINRAENVLYRANFVRGLCRMLTEVRTLREVPGPAADPLRLRTIRAFDHHFTAPAAGYASVDDYYADAGAGAVLDRLHVPAYLLTAANDPFVPADLVAAHHGAAGGRVRVAVTDRGGHVGYRVRDGRRAAFWAAQPVFDYLDGCATRR